MDSLSSKPIRFYVPTPVLEAANEWQNQHSAILTMPLPTDTEPWDGTAETVPETFNITTLQENP